MVSVVSSTADVSNEEDVISVIFGRTMMLGSEKLM